MEQQLKGSCKQQTSETPSNTETATYTETWKAKFHCENEI